MSKITFRADDDLVSRLEALDASKSEVMREALRDYLDRTERETPPSSAATEAISIDELLTDRLETLLAEREQTPQQPPAVAAPPDITVNVSVDGASSEDVSVDRESTTKSRKTQATTEPTATERSESTDCSQCGETLNDSHVYCPNCGNKASRRLFCECGDEIQSDWSFCPSCGRRTPSADVLDTP